MGEAVEALGAKSVTIPSPEKYQAMNQGTVDGAVFPAIRSKSYRLEEILADLIAGFNLSMVGSGYCINASLWDELPEDVREAFRPVHREIQIKQGLFNHNKLADLHREFQDLGIGVHSLSQADQKSPGTHGWPASEMGTGHAGRGGAGGSEGTEPVQDRD